MHPKIAYALVLLIWSTTPLAIQLGNRGYTPFASLALRNALAIAAALAVAVLIYRAGRLQREHWPAYLAASLTLFPSLPMSYVAINYLPSGMLPVMFATTPFMMGLLSMLILGEKPFTPLKLVGLFFSLAGVALVAMDQSSLGDKAGMGILLLITANLLWSLSNVLVMKLSKNVDSFAQTQGAMLFAMPGFLLCWLLFDGETPDFSDQGASASIVYLALFGSVLGFFVFYRVLQTFPVAQTSLLPLLTPLLALAFGALFADEHLGPRVLTGVALILFGLALYEILPRWRDRRQRRISAAGPPPIPAGGAAKGE